jgi:divalent metal cation (Fe/Co/Zn/Cd) transporter
VIVAVAPGAPVVEGHQAADRVEAAIEGELPGADVVVHIEPRRHGLDLRDRVLAIALAEPLVKEAHDITIYEHDGSASVSLHLKFPTDLPLQEALEVTERIQQAICARPGVSEVQTHEEPMEYPLNTEPATTPSDLGAVREVERIVLGWTGKAPRGTRLLRTDAGRVIFLTLVVGAQTSLVDAHQLGSELEEELRQQIPDIVDVIVHTAI